MMGFPDILLLAILDHLKLEELLLSAMPVSRFWRWSVIEHPRYWRWISLDEYTPAALCLRVANLFFLRLERAGEKPVDVRIWMRDPTAVLDTLSGNMHHVCRLTVSSWMAHANMLFRTMRDTPAPILESLNLAFEDEREPEDPITIPNVLFALEAPVLGEVAITNCLLPSDGELPTWLSNVTSFSYHYRLVRTLVQQLPNIFASCPRLQDLGLGGPIKLDNPAFLQAGTWARLEVLSLDCEVVTGLTALPLSHVPRIEITDILKLTADHIVFIVNTLMKPGQLDVTLNADAPYNYRGYRTVHIYAVRMALKCLSDAGTSRGRWMHGFLPPDAPGSHPADFITAFQHPPLLARIASLCIALEGWELLVGWGYLAHFPEVEALVLTLDHRSWFEKCKQTWRAPAHTAKLALPRLRRIVFRYEHDGAPYDKPVLQLSDLAHFATQQLSGVQMPLRLSLEGVEVQGVLEEFTDVFQF